MSPSQKPPEPPVLEMNDVAVGSIHRTELIVFDHLHWQVRRGDYWVVGGPPVSGKSDLLVTAAGLMRPQRGVVRLFGEEISELHEKERLELQLCVGMVFGSGGRLFNQLTVAENLALPLGYHRQSVASAADERVQSVLEAMGLEEIARAMPVSVNRHLRQRVALARALVLSPELLFLDNPLIGMDPRETRWWLEFLDRLSKGHPILAGAGLTLVVGTDDLEPWSDHARQFALIQSGRLMPAGSRATLVSHANPALREWLPLAWLKE